VIGVGQQLETQALFCAELLVGIDAVEAYSEDHCVALSVLGLVHLELVGFARSARSLVFGIEIENDPLATVILEADRAILGWQGEIGSHASLRRLSGARQHLGDQEHGSHYEHDEQDDPRHERSPQEWDSNQQSINHRDSKVQEGSVSGILAW
jgi:hypothetical protein